MPLTPVEVRHFDGLRRGFLGYKRGPVHRLMDEIADSFESVWRERADLVERVEALETELGRHVELEALLRATLVSAERASQEMSEQARREGEVIIGEANSEARRVLRDAISDKERLLGEARRVRALLRSALEVMEDVPHEQGEDEPEEEAASTPATPPAPVAASAPAPAPAPASTTTPPMPPLAPPAPAAAPADPDATMEVRPSPDAGEPPRRDRFEDDDDLGDTGMHRLVG
jgi:cell division initiation protein